MQLGDFTESKMKKLSAPEGTAVDEVAELLEEQIIFI